MVTQLVNLKFQVVFFAVGTLWCLLTSASGLCLGSVLRRLLVGFMWESSELLCENGER